MITLKQFTHYKKHLAKNILPIYNHKSQKKHKTQIQAHQKKLSISQQIQHRRKKKTILHQERYKKKDTYFCIYLLKL
jgi:hypothetical protein